MILSDSEITEWVSRTQMISPYDPQNIQPASYDVSLSGRFLIFNYRNKLFIDPGKSQDDLTSLVVIDEVEEFMLHPGDFVLGSTFEYFQIPVELAARLEGKSSLGRIGLVIHSTAGWFDPGFKGTGTLELGNISRLPIILRKGMLIGQMAFMKMSQPPIVPYGDKLIKSRYQNQIEPTASRSHQ